jgi:hypothetical protein
VKLIEQARQEAMAVLEADPHLESDENRELRGAVDRMKKVVTGEVS